MNKAKFCSLLLINALGIINRACSEDVAKTTDKHTEVEKVTIQLKHDSGCSIQIEIEDKKLIDELILKPLRDAKRETMPAAYVSGGFMSLERKDGSKIEYALYIPFGHISEFKRDSPNSLPSTNRIYSNADFLLLHKVLKEALKKAVHNPIFSDEKMQSDDVGNR